MRDITTIGIDLAKNVIQIHGANRQGKKVFKRRVSRNQFLQTMVNLPKVLVGMEACGGAHYWAKELMKLNFDVKLMSPQKVKKYADHNKNDSKDAEACCEAVTRGSMRFVSIKTEEQMEMQSYHRVRSHYIKQRTALMNMIRGILLEHGIAIAKGTAALSKGLKDVDALPLSGKNKALLLRLKEDFLHLNEQVTLYTNEIERYAKENPLCEQLKTIDGIGTITATALVAKIGNGSEFKKGRELSAYLGLVPRQISSGDTQRLVGITKHGDSYIRQLLVHGGRAAVKSAQRRSKETGEFLRQDPHSEWIRALVERVGSNKASVAVANKNARLVIGLFKTQTNFDPLSAH